MKRNVTVNLSLPAPLFLVFLVLKLTNTIDWPWFWVTSPLWLPFAIFAAVVIAFFIIAGIFAVIAAVLK